MNPVLKRIQFLVAILISPDIKTRTARYNKIDISGV
jgi:hypothetical protein